MTSPRKVIPIIAIALLCSEGCASRTTFDARSEEIPDCDNEFGFDITYLPEGFSAERRSGPAPEAPPAGEEQAVVHYEGSDGRFIEIRRPATLFTELALSDEAPSIEVLGDPTQNFGPREPGGDDFIVQFTFEGGAIKKTCSEYSLDEYGVPLEELKRVAEGLAAA